MKNVQISRTVGVMWACQPHFKRAIENMQSDQVSSHKLCYFLTREMGEHFQLIDK